MWSNDYEWRPYFTTITTYQYYDNVQPLTTIDTIYMDTLKYVIH
jgi:hypothetical protein